MISFLFINLKYIIMEKAKIMSIEFKVPLGLYNVILKDALDRKMTVNNYLFTIVDIATIVDVSSETLHTGIRIEFLKKFFCEHRERCMNCGSISMVWAVKLKPKTNINKVKKEDIIGYYCKFCDNDKDESIAIYSTDEENYPEGYYQRCSR